jgi:hypothetical protein
VSRYSVHEARGNLTLRQQEANKAECLCYAEQHLNASTNPKINYALAIVSHNASERSKDWARTYTRIVSSTFCHPDRGVSIGPPRGSYNVKLCKCPAILLEPGFVSNPDFAAIVRTGEGIDALAKCLVDSIEECFPGGGLIGLSAGHAYRGKPDPGAPVYEPDGLHDPDFDDETELNIAICESATEMLLAIGEAPQEP